MGKKITTPLKGVALWFSAITLPYIIRRVAGPKFTGEITMLNISDDKSVGYYVFPGMLYPGDEVFRDFFQPKKYDLNVVHYGRQDYDPDLAAEAVAKHAKNMGYEEVRIISIATGDQLLNSLEVYMKDRVNEDSIEIVTIDSIPNPEFIHDKFLRPLKSLEPVLVTLRTLGGWLLELPIIRRTGRWHSPAIVLEQLVNLPSWAYDYPAEEILGCVVAVIKDGHVFYTPDNSEKLFDVTFNWLDDGLDELDAENPFCRVFHNYLGDLADFRDDCTRKGYERVFHSLSWQF